MIENATGKQIAAFTVVTLFLVIGTDFEATAKLSVAFAYLILLSTALTIGPKALRRVEAVFS